MWFIYIHASDFELNIKTCDGELFVSDCRRNSSVLNFKSLVIVKQVLIIPAENSL